MWAEPTHLLPEAGGPCARVGGQRRALDPPRRAARRLRRGLRLARRAHGDAFDEADVLFFDGTFWSSDELVAAGLSRARAEDMAHLPIGGESGSLARLSPRRARAQDLHAHEQLEPDPRRGLPRARAPSRRRAGRSPTTAWRSSP